MSIRPETDNYFGCSLSQEVAGHKMKKATIQQGKYLWNINWSLVPTDLKYNVMLPDETQGINQCSKKHWKKKKIGKSRRRIYSALCWQLVMHSHSCMSASPCHWGHQLGSNTVSWANNQRRGLQALWCMRPDFTSAFRINCRHTALPTKYCCSLQVWNTEASFWKSI